ncbi:LysR substrate-binding domain-containing protein [Nisaea sp.]|uniref:LysR substrate-binding domain-containing protein n=1 Tax=Nisaea sp. TaxID=2024842 RepID=UPI003B52A32A
MKVEFLLPKPFPLPPPNSLRAFEAAGRHQNFRAASEELGVSQGAVAQQIRKLESILGLPLFERHAKGLSFTINGRAYHEQVSAAFALLRDATRTLKPETDTVTISVTPTFAAKWLLPNLPRLTASHPEIDLRIVATERVLSFHSDGIDLAIRQGVPPFGAGIDARLLFRNDIIAVAAPNLVSDRPRPFAPEVFRSLTLLHDAHNLWPDFLQAVVGSHDRGRQNRMTFSQTALSIDAALNGQGIALASRFLVEKDLESGRLLEVAGQSLSDRRDFHLLAPRNKSRASAIRIVMEWLIRRSHSDS